LATTKEAAAHKSRKRNARPKQQGPSIKITGTGIPPSLIAAMESSKEHQQNDSTVVTDPDWVGQIVGLGLDGTLTVRLGGLNPCRDVLVDADSILAVIDDGEHLEAVDLEDDYMDLDSLEDDDSEWSDLDTAPISESVEYEGGERLDNDDNSEAWISDEEDDQFEDAEEHLPDTNGDVDMMDAEEPTGAPAKLERSLRHLLGQLGDEPPPQFLVLDREPPSDQFGLLSSSSAKAPLKRIAKEHKILANSLPEGEIYVRTYESRLDLLRCLIIGPKDTPYESAPFLIDLYLGEKFPDEPPTAHFHSWTSGMGRINPNLYEEGKICLSLLGTWSGKADNERWSEKATILQLLVSLQGLVFVSKPFYNEAGFEGYENDLSYKREAEQYSEKAFVMSRGFVKHALLRPPGGLEEILAWLYLPHQKQIDGGLLVKLIQQGNCLRVRSERARQEDNDALMDAAGSTIDPTKVFLKPLSKGANVMLKRLLGELQAQLDTLSKGKGRDMSDDLDD
jgi:ubiquitin-conjugating enzyme E2 O